MSLSQNRFSLLGDMLLIYCSIFTLTIPLEEADVQVNTHTSVHQYKELFTVLNQNKILVVDDDKIQLQLMEELLSPIFKHIEILNDSSEIESVLEQNTYDVILSDIQMPKMDGFEMIQLLRTNPKYSDIPVIALSGKRDLTLEDFTNAGFTSAHQKPIQLQELLVLITQLLHPEHQIEFEPVPNASLSNEKPTTLYDINQIKQFIGEDSTALRKFVVIFVDSTQENILDLNYAKDDFDWDTISNIAHKMLPMFKQLQINHLVPALEKLEDKTLQFQTKEDLSQYIATLTQQIQEVITDLQEKYLD